MPNKNQELSFSVEGEAVYVHVAGGYIIPFANLDDYKKFANDMLAMIPEIDIAVSEECF